MTTMVFLMLYLLELLLLFIVIKQFCMMFTVVAVVIHLLLDTVIVIDSLFDLVKEGYDGIGFVSIPIDRYLYKLHGHDLSFMTVLVSLLVV